ncbi:MAG: SgcJ/EcaC family oxidoreductase [Steroidobacteraceae bacterium]|nr:SgcJ/EcaC family oxidoreductase [Steroidobacteraceae bacterium]MCC7198359.1 SgcJ/EcaC family oxidoreductase [Gammaproteobacteria bacterium]
MIQKLLLVILLAVTGSAFAATPDEEAIAGIRASGAAWTAAFKSGDIDALMQLYMPDAVVALHDQPKLKGLDAIRAYFAPRIGKGKVSFEIELEELEVHGNIAHMVSKYWFTLEPADGGPIYREPGRSALLYERDTDGRWKIRLDIDQSTPDVSFAGR